MIYTTNDTEDFFNLLTYLIKIILFNYNEPFNYYFILNFNAYEIFISTHPTLTHTSVHTHSHKVSDISLSWIILKSNVHLRVILTELSTVTLKERLSKVNSL